MYAKYFLPIDGETKLMGVIGENIAYTQSPRLHNRAACILGINAAYLALPLPAAQVHGFLDVAWHMGALGFNVTTPHKGLVAELTAGSNPPKKLKSVGPKSELALTSVNTLYRGETWWQAASTDGEGFVRGLGRLAQPGAAIHEIIFLGTGGAVVAILAHLNKLTGTDNKFSALARIKILRRTAARDGEIRGALTRATPEFADLSVDALAHALRGKDSSTLLVQGTSGPQRGDDLQHLVPALADYNGAVVDLVYGKPSALYFAAVARDLAVLDGEPMLIEQARLAQKLWWGKSASYEDMALALRAKATRT